MTPAVKILCVLIASFTVSYVSPFAITKASAESSDGSVWRTTFSQKETRSVHIRFVRGAAEIRRRPGPIVVEVRKSSPSGLQGTVSINYTRSDDHVDITDTYPMAPFAYRKECLPPANLRGDFWNSDVKLRTVIWAPDETVIDIRYMDE